MVAIDARRKYIAWYCLPENERDPQSKSEMAYKLKVSLRTLENWGKAIDLSRSMLDSTGSEFDDFMKYLKQRVYDPKGNYKDRELFARLNGWYVEKREDKLSFEPTANDHVQWGRELVNRLREDYGQHGGVCPVCQRSQVLLNEVCVDTEQEHSAES